jgi:hypothetical protein
MMTDLAWAVILVPLLLFYIGHQAHQTNSKLDALYKLLEIRTRELDVLRTIKSNTEMIAGSVYLLSLGARNAATKKRFAG